MTAVPGPSGAPPDEDDGGDHAARLEGFCLAAVLHGHGTETTGTLGPRFRDPARRMLEIFAAQARTERRDMLARWTAQLAQKPVDSHALATLPLRAQSLLCDDLPKDAARQLLGRTPPPRRGYRPPEGLRRWLRGLARQLSTRGTHEGGAP